VTDSTQNPAVRLDVDGAVTRITLDRPERHNALRAVEVAALRAMLDGVEADTRTRVLVLTGAGESTFCSGASLAQMRTGEMSGAIFDTLTDRLARLRVPTICRLNGSVYGGGAELALCCDFRVGGPGVRLSVPAARLGVCYPLGGLTRYVSRLGLGPAMRLLLAAEELDAEALLRIGFLTHRAEAGAIDTATDELSGHLASLAPLAVQTMKRTLVDIASGAVDREEIARMIARCNESKDFVEGLAAWSEGRDPDFRGT
jgi:enoyl-CoA hydratase/carnithine racemase